MLDNGHVLGTQRQIKPSPCCGGLHFLGVNQRVPHCTGGYGGAEEGSNPALGWRMGREGPEATQCPGLVSVGWGPWLITEQLWALAFAPGLVGMKTDNVGEVPSEGPGAYTRGS